MGEEWGVTCGWVGGCSAGRRSQGALMKPQVSAPSVGDAAPFDRPPMTLRCPLYTGRARGARKREKEE